MSRNQTVTAYRICDNPESRLAIVFVHGLMGSPTDTWACDDKPASFWPKWLCDKGNVWIVDYPADLFWWSNTGMALPERAKSVIDVLTNYGLGSKPIVWITHSLGGLLVKSMLRAAQELNNPAWQPVAKQTRGVAFLGTPHTGASLGTLANLLRTLTSANASQLQSNEPHLLDLTSWYSRNAKRLGFRTIAYYEKGTIKGVKVVDEGSADPRVDDCVPVPSDAHHMDICKPKGAHDPVYLGVLRFVEALQPPATQSADGSASEQPAHDINTVFGIHRGDTLHYVQRTKVDDALIGQLIGGKHLCIYGSSKQGKTPLRKKHISPAEELCVVCDRKWASVDVFAALLKAADCQVQRSSEDQSSSVYSARLPNGENTLDVDFRR